MFLPGGQSDLVVRPSATGRVNVRTIEENIVARWRGPGSLFGLELENVGSLVIPVCDHVRSKIDVVVGRCRAVDHDGSCNAIAVLNREVTMIPANSQFGWYRQKRCHTYHEVPYCCALKV